MQSLFPDQEGYRKNLVTVPSCSAHNTKKSRDDHYVGRVIRLHNGNNRFANDIPKLLRELHRSRTLGGTLFRNPRPVTVRGWETATFEVDLDRFGSVVDKMARALYHHETGLKYLAPLAFWTNGLFHLDHPMADWANAELRRVGRVAARACAPLPVKGENPEIFTYQLYLELPTRIMVRMVFYEGLEIVVYSSQEPGIEAPQGLGPVARFSR